MRGSLFVMVVVVAGALGCGEGTGPEQRNLPEVAPPPLLEGEPLPEVGRLMDGLSGDAGTPSDAGAASPPTAANPAHHELLIALATWAGAPEDSRGGPPNAVYLDDVKPYVEEAVRYWTDQLEGRVQFTVTYLQDQPGATMPVLPAGPCDAVGWGMGPAGSQPGQPVYEATNRRFVTEVAAALGFSQDFTLSAGQHFVVFTRPDVFLADGGLAPAGQTCIHAGNSFTRGVVGSLWAGGLVHAFYEEGSEGWIVTHELGHNLGFSHANGVGCGSPDGGTRRVDDVSANCHFSEYSNPYSVMGRPNSGALDGMARMVAGLTDSTSLVDLSQGGSATLYAVGSMHGLRFASVNVGGVTYLAEYRAPVGPDAAFVSSVPGRRVDTSVQLYRTFSRRRVPHPEWTYHLDADPGHGSTGLRAGQSVALAGGGRLSVTGMTADTATVRFDPLGQPATLPAPPAAVVPVAVPAAFSLHPMPEVAFSWTGSSVPGVTTHAFEVMGTGWASAALGPSWMGTLSGQPGAVRANAAMHWFSDDVPVVAGACNDDGCSYSPATPLPASPSPVTAVLTTGRLGELRVTLSDLDPAQHARVVVRWCNLRLEGRGCSAWTGRSSATWVPTRSAAVQLKLNTLMGTCGRATTCTIPAGARARAGDRLRLAVEVEGHNGVLSRAGGVRVPLTRQHLAVAGVTVPR